MTSDDSSTTGNGARRGGRRSRRDEIVVAATEAFSQNGFHNTSLHTIADQLGITPAGILHHFKVKENLLIEVLGDRDRDGAPGSHDGTAVLEAMRQVTVRNEHQPELTRLFAVLSAESLTQDHPAKQWFTERYQNLRRELSDALEEQLGPIPDSVRPQLADTVRSLIATMDGLQVQWLLDPQQAMPSAYGLTMDALVGSLRAAVEAARADAPEDRSGH